MHQEYEKRKVPLQTDFKYALRNRFGSSGKGNGDIKKIKMENDYYNYECPLCKTSLSKVPFDASIDEDHFHDISSMCNSRSATLGRTKYLHPGCTSDGSIGTDCGTCKRVYYYELQSLSFRNEIPFECQICFTKFSSGTNYVLHQRKSNCGFTITFNNFSGDIFCTCDICCKPLSSLKMLERHRQTHKRRTHEVMCDMCELMCYNRSVLISHKKKCKIE